MDKLNLLFMFYVQQIQSLYKRLPRQLQVRIEKWVLKLSESPANVTFCKARNDHAKVLLYMIQHQEFEPPFDKVPDENPLGNLPKYLILRVEGTVSPSKGRASDHTSPSKDTWQKISERMHIAASETPHSTCSVPSTTLGITAPTSDAILLAAKRQREAAKKKLRRHHSCYDTAAAGCTGMASCPCHCNLHKEPSGIGAGTLAYHLKEASSSRKAKSSITVPAATTATATASGTAMPDKSVTWASEDGLRAGMRQPIGVTKSFLPQGKRQQQSLRTIDTRGVSELPTNFWEHESILDKPPASRSDRLVRRLQRRSASPEKAGVGGSDENKPISFLSRSKPLPALQHVKTDQMDIMPKAAAVNVLETRVQDALTSTDTAAARLEAVQSRDDLRKFEEDARKGTPRNTLLHSVLHNMSSHLQQLRDRFGAKEVGPMDGVGSSPAMTSMTTNQSVGHQSSRDAISSAVDGLKDIMLRRPLAEGDRAYSENAMSPSTEESILAVKVPIGAAGAPTRGAGANPPDQKGRFGKMRSQQSGASTSRPAYARASASAANQQGQTMGFAPLYAETSAETSQGDGQLRSYFIHQLDKRPVRTPAKPRCLLELDAGDEIDLECAHYGPPAASGLYSPTRLPVTPITPDGPNLFPEYARKNTMLGTQSAHSIENKQMGEPVPRASLPAAASEKPRRAMQRSDGSQPFRAFDRLSTQRTDSAGFALHHYPVLQAEETSIVNPTWNVPIVPLLSAKPAVT